MPTLNTVVQFLSVTVLLAVSSTFGFMAMPIEMGIAVVAGALGMAFSNIDKISEFKGGGFHAKMNEVQKIIDKQTEPNLDNIQENNEEDLKSMPDGAIKIINALQHPAYTWRSITGLMRATGLDRNSLSSEMAWVVSNGYAEHSLGRPGSIWTLTNKGRQLRTLIDLPDIKKA